MCFYEIDLWKFDFDVCEGVLKVCYVMIEVDEFVIINCGYFICGMCK